MKNPMICVDLLDTVAMENDHIRGESSTRVRVPWLC